MKNEIMNEELEKKSGICYPKGFFEKNLEIYKGDKKFANGIIRVMSYYYCEIEGEQKFFVDVLFKRKNFEWIKKISYSLLFKQALSKEVPDGFGFLCTEREKCCFLTEAISETIENMEPEQQFVLEHGFNNVNGTMHYALGGLVFPKIENRNYMTIPKFKLKEEPGDGDYMEWLIKFSKISPDAPAIFIACLSEFVKGFPSSEGKSNSYMHDYIVYITGGTGNGKSSLAKLLVGIYEDDPNIVSLSSEKDSIIGLGEFKDFPIMIDDLNKTDSVRIKQSNEKKLSDIISQKNGLGRITHKGKTARISSVMLVTAEYVLKSHSTINRCVIAEMNETINIKKLSWLQNNYSMYIRFVIEFLTWLCINHHSLSKSIPLYWEKCKEKQKKCNKKCDGKYDGLLRILQTQSLMRVTLFVFQSFLEEKSMFTIGENYKLVSRIRKSIKNCIERTMGYVVKESNRIGREYIDKLSKFLIDEPDKYIAKNYAEYKKALNKGEKKYFFEEKDCICISGENLVSLIGSITRDKKTTKQEISSQLDYYELLKTQAGERSFPRLGQEKKKKDKTRYYHIKKESLYEMRKEKKVTSIWDL